MKLNKDIDLGKSFEKLKSALLSSTRSIKRDQPATYAYAFGRLETAVKILFVQCTDLTMKDIQDELEGPDDLKEVPVFSNDITMDSEMEEDKRRAKL